MTVFTQQSCSIDQGMAAKRKLSMAGPAIFSAHMVTALRWKSAGAPYVVAFHACGLQHIFDEVSLLSGCCRRWVLTMVAEDPDLLLHCFLASRRTSKNFYFSFWMQASFVHDLFERPSAAGSLGPRQIVRQNDLSGRQYIYRYLGKNRPGLC